jgi:hypothetical protein
MLDMITCVDSHRLKATFVHSSVPFSVSRERIERWVWVMKLEEVNDRPQENLLQGPASHTTPWLLFHG